MVRMGNLFASGRAQTLGRLSIFCLAGEERSQEMENSGHCLLHEVVGGSNVEVEFTIWSEEAVH